MKLTLKEIPRSFLLLRGGWWTHSWRALIHIYRFLNESYISEMFEKHTELITENIKKYSHEEKQKLKAKLKKISREILADYQKDLKNHRKETYTDPVMSVVSMLPKDELAAMAESLVNLTSFKRKVTLET